MEIAYVKGDATCPRGAGPRVIVHVCNDLGAWGKGFVLAVSRKWPAAEQCYREWHRGEGSIPFGLGHVQFVEVEPALWVANLIGQRGIRRSGAVPPVRYEAIQIGLSEIAGFAVAKQATIHMPRIGCGLAGGEWNRVAEIVQQELADKGLSVTVYDLE